MARGTRATPTPLVQTAATAPTVPFRPLTARSTGRHYPAGATNQVPPPRHALQGGAATSHPAPQRRRHSTVTRQRAGYQATVPLVKPQL